MKKNIHKFTYKEYIDTGYGHTFLLLLSMLWITFISVSGMVLLIEYFDPSTVKNWSSFIKFVVICLVLIIWINIFKFIHFNKWRVNSYNKKLDKLKRDIDKCNIELSKFRRQ